MKSSGIYACGDNGSEELGKTNCSTSIDESRNQCQLARQVWVSLMERFLEGLTQMMSLGLKVPHYSRLSRRAETSRTGLPFLFAGGTSERIFRHSPHLKEEGHLVAYGQKKDHLG